MNQNGGAQALLEQLKRDIAETDVNIVTARECIAGASSDGSRVQPGAGVSGACASALELYQDGRRAQVGALQVVQCWAGQSTAAEPSLAFTDRADRAKVGASAQCVARRGMECISYATGGTDTRQRSSSVASILSGLKEAFAALGATARDTPVATTDVSSDVAGLHAAATSDFQPLLDAPAGTSATNNPGLNDAIDSILNADGATDARGATAPRSIPFEHETPRTASPLNGFLKRISGEFRSATGNSELLIRVADIDRNWLTTDQCLTLDVVFQFSSQAKQPDGTSTTLFGSSTSSLNAPDGTADVRVPVVVPQLGHVTDVSVTSVGMRACDQPKKQSVDCAGALEARQNLVDAGRRILIRRDQLWERLEPLETALDELKRDLSDKTDDWVRARVALRATIKVALVAAPVAGVPVAAPILLGITGYEHLEILKNASEGQAKASSFIDLSVIAAGALSEWVDRAAALADALEAIENANAYRNLTPHVDKLAEELQGQVALIKRNLAATKLELDKSFSALDQLKADCGVAAK